MARNNGYGFECGRDGCGFTSTGWPTEAAALERQQQHEDEHDTGSPMPELVDSGLERF